MGPTPNKPIKSGRKKNKKKLLCRCAPLKPVWLLAGLSAEQRGGVVAALPDAPRRGQPGAAAGAVAGAVSSRRLGHAPGRSPESRGQKEQVGGREFFFFSRWFHPHLYHITGRAGTKEVWFSRSSCFRVRCFARLDELLSYVGIGFSRSFMVLFPRE